MGGHSERNLAVGTEFSPGVRWFSSVTDSAVAEVIADRNIDARLKRLGLVDSFGKGYGYRSDVRDANGIGVDNIVREALELVRN